VRKISIAWPVVIFVVIVVFLVILGYSFFSIWTHKGDAGGQAYGAFLAYVATSISVLVTLVYVYLTREALKTAQQANEEQRREWEQRVNVTLKFWIPITQPSPTDTKPLHLMPNVRYPRFSCVIWNYSEQSVLIHWIEITDIHSAVEENCILKPVEQVIQQHQTLEIDIEWELFRFLCNPEAFTPQMLRLEKDSKILKINIRYSDWRQQQTKSEDICYKFYGDDEDEMDGPALYGNMISVNKRQVKYDESEN